MNRSFLFWLWCCVLCACQSAPPAKDSTPHLSLALEVPANAQAPLWVELEFPADRAAETILVQRRGFGGSSLEDCDLSDLEVRTADGQRLPCVELQAGRWKVQAPAQTKLRARWAVQPNAHFVSERHTDYFRACLDAERLHAIGAHLLYLPEQLLDAPALPMHLEWRGCQARGWQQACSFGTKAQLEFTATPASLLNSLFTAGAIDLVERQIQGSRLVLALPRSGLQLESERFADLSAAVVDAGREFFRDRSTQYYLISAVATGQPNPQQSSLAGTCLNDAFALFVQRDSDVRESSRLYPRVVQVLMHEHLHNWIGGQTPIAEPEQQAYWLSEGFTEYFTRRLLYQHGYLDRQGYAHSLEQSLREYESNPHCTAPNQAIIDGFWQDPQLGQLPYRRGDVVAMRLDQAIRERSAGQQCLDDFMRALVHEGQQGTHFDAEALLTRMGQWTNPQVQAELRAVLVEGARLELGPDALGAGLRLERVALPTYDLGFDFEATRQARAIRGLRPGSAAERAGLREGQALASFRDERRADRPVLIEVLEDGQRVKIEYLPTGELQEVPSVQLQEALP